MSLPWGAVVLLLGIRFASMTAMSVPLPRYPYGLGYVRVEVEEPSWGVWALVKGQGCHLQGPEIQKLTVGHFMRTLISVTEGDFELNVQD